MNEWMPYGIRNVKNFEFKPLCNRVVTRARAEMIVRRYLANLFGPGSFNLYGNDFCLLNGAYVGTLKEE